jgi:hypothetical protein
MEPASPRFRLDHHLERLETMWSRLDQLVDSLSPEDWARPHGPDWVLADVPYHLSYFDRDIIAAPIRLGESLPAEAREAQRTLGDMNAWNARRFGERPAEQTVAQGIALMRASREEIRQAVAGLTDADLERKAWLSLVSARGWRSVDSILTFCLAHLWNEFMQLRIHAGRREPAPTPEATHTGLDLLIRLFQIFLKPETPPGARFTLLWSISGPGGGDWTMHLAAGATAVAEGAPSGGAGAADLVIAMPNETAAAETFVKFFNGIVDPAAAIQSGAITVSSFEGLAAFGQLFPLPALDQPLPALP